MPAFRLPLPLLSLLALLPAAAQEEPPGLLPIELRSDGEEVMAAFAEPAEANRASVLEVYAPPRQLVGLATVIGDGGILAAKASELVGGTANIEDLKVRNARHRSGAVELLGLDIDSDLIFLRTDLEGLRPVTWAAEDPQLADWVFGFTGRLRTVTSGVISANSRELTSSGAFLGVSMHPDPGADNKALVSEVLEGSAAQQAGIVVGDYIVGIEGRRSADAEALANELRHYLPGMVVALMVERGGTVYQTPVELGYRSSYERRQTSNAAIAGQVSERQNGFGRIYQHTALLAPETMGGPLLDLDGRCVGLNIARLDRTATLALPPEQLLLALRRVELNCPELGSSIASLETAWGPVLERQEQLKAMSEAAAAAEPGEADAPTTAPEAPESAASASGAAPPAAEPAPQS